MKLSEYRVSASIAVSDMAVAVNFYEDTLGLIPTSSQTDESRWYPCGDGTALHIYLSPTNAGSSTATVATWYVLDLEQVVDELTSRGVTFQRYADPTLHTDARGIHTLDGGQVAWFDDPDGHTFAVECAAPRPTSGR